MRTKRYISKKSLLFVGLICIALALAIEVLLFSLRYENLWVWYADVRKFLFALEEKIVSIDMPLEFFAVIMLLYIVKSFFPIFVTSTVCFITGAVLPMHFAIPVNILGIMLQFSIKYAWGSKTSGDPYAWRIIRQNEILRHAIQAGGRGNPLTLVALRLFPGMPLNTISSIYGSLHFGYLKFIILSTLGFLPKLISFTFVGSNLFDPLSKGFLIPLMILSFLMGLSCLSVNGFWTLFEKFVSLYNKKKVPAPEQDGEQKESKENDQ